MLSAKNQARRSRRSRNWETSNSGERNRRRHRIFVPAGRPCCKAVLFWFCMESWYSTLKMNTRDSVNRPALLCQLFSASRGGPDFQVSFDAQIVRCH